jgi:energy-coupling factor transporter transmembrane protein EcfT
VQPDLLGLEITKGELKRLTGVKPELFLLPSLMKNREQRFAFLMKEVRETLLLVLLITGLIYALITLTIGSQIGLGIILLIVVAIAVVVGRWLWRRFRYPKALIILLNEIDKYHAEVQAVDHLDQQAISENSENNSHKREIIIAALQLVREDLVRGLKIERVLRDNKKSLTDQQELSVNNLANLQALQVSSSAGEYAQILNQLLQIDLDVQSQIRKLQQSHP